VFLVNPEFPEDPEHLGSKVLVCLEHLVRLEVLEYPGVLEFLECLDPVFPEYPFHLANLEDLEHLGSIDPEFLGVLEFLEDLVFPECLDPVYLVDPVHLEFVQLNPEHPGC
jgi:hypothetical protein